VHFTEVTVVSGPHRNVNPRGPYPTDWLTTPEGENEQADYLERFYGVLFSHPGVRAITYWDFSDKGAWLGASGGLLRADMSPKPAYTRLLGLLHKRWWTNASGKTDPAGRYRSRAYCGDHRITVTDGKGKRTTIAIQLPLNSGGRSVTVKLH
jgi:hypothetical protein